MTEGIERWKGKTALVTGASSGIGLAIVRALARIGVRLVLTARRAERLEALKSELEAHGVEVLAVSADLRRTDAIDSLFRTVRNQWGGIDVLINNAGLGWRELLKTVDFTHLQSMMDVNIRAATICIREALKDMQGKQDAAIINISSLAGHRVPPGIGGTFYSASKHALKAIADGLRQELVAENSPIKLGTISPGMVETEFQTVAAPGGNYAGYEYPPLRAEDVADAVLYMLSAPRNVQISDILMRPLSQPH